MAEKDLLIEENETLIETLKAQCLQSGHKMIVSPTHSLKHVEKLVEKVKTLEETIASLKNSKDSDFNNTNENFNLQELLKSKELEFNEYKEEMAEKLIGAKKKMTDLIETAKKRENSLKEKVLVVF